MRYEVWFSYNGVRRWRDCKEPQESNQTVAMLETTEGVTDIESIERGE